MAKIFGTIKGSSGAVELLSWPSKKSFETTESWCDEKFICLASADACMKHGLYSEPEEHIDLSLPMAKDSFRIVLSKDQVDAHNMIYKAFQKQEKQLNFNV